MIASPVPSRRISPARMARTGGIARILARKWAIAEEIAARQAFEAEFLALRREWASLLLALLARKCRPDQPRVPAGSLEGGQWTSEGGGGDTPEEYALFDLRDLFTGFGDGYSGESSDTFA